MHAMNRRARAGLGALVAVIALAAGCDSGSSGGTKGEPQPIPKEDFEKYANPTKGQKKAPDPNAALMKKYANPNAK